MPLIAPRVPQVRVLRVCDRQLSILKQLEGSGGQVTFSEAEERRDNQIKIAEQEEEMTKLATECNKLKRI
jgi:hypothetical protein